MSRSIIDVYRTGQIYTFVKILMLLCQVAFASKHSNFYDVISSVE